MKESPTTCNPVDYKAQREKLGLTQSQLAEILGVSRATVNRRETGQMPIHAEASLALWCISQNWKKVFEKITR